MQRSHRFRISVLFFLLVVVGLLQVIKFYPCHKEHWAVHEFHDPIQLSLLNDAKLVTIWIVNIGHPEFPDRILSTASKKDLSYNNNKWVPSPGLSQLG